MRSLGSLPKPVLILEALGMVLLGTAWLSLKDYIDLPAPFDGAAWGHRDGVLRHSVDASRRRRAGVGHGPEPGAAAV